MTEPAQTVFQSERFRVLRHALHGTDGRRLTKDTIQHPGSVAILPLVADDRVCLIRNFRLAVSETLTEIPAGTLDRVEDPLDAARRELAEETGYRAAKLELLCEFFMSPGILHERMYLYLASGLTAGPPALEPSETIENLVVPLDEALAMVRDGRIRDAKTMLALLYYQSRG